MKASSVVSLLLIGVAFCVDGVSACHGAGISPGGGKALLAMLVVFSPVIVVGGAGWLTFKAAQTTFKGAKRTTNFIKTMTSKAIKKVGRGAFNDYVFNLQEQLAKDPNGPHEHELRLQLGVAMFLDNNWHESYDNLSRSIAFANANQASWEKLPSAYHVRGLVNQLMFDYPEAIKDYQKAIAAHKLLQEMGVTPTAVDGSASAPSVPQLTLAEAYNSLAFAHLQWSLYPPKNDTSLDTPQKNIELLQNAIIYFKKAIKEDSTQGSYYYNMGRTIYYITITNISVNNGTWVSNAHGDAPPATGDDGDSEMEHVVKLLKDIKLTEEDKAALTESIALFDEAIATGTFGTGAEAYAMKSQALMLLGKAEEANQNVAAALDADPKIFLVDLEWAQLSTPWPLPQPIPSKLRKEPHEFEKTVLMKPTWCSNCLGFITTPSGYKCTHCDYTVHSKCVTKVKSANCWNREAEDQQLLQKLSHVHEFVEARFNKPTWCDQCNKFVKEVFGKQGFECGCGFKIHKACLADAKAHPKHK